MIILAASGSLYVFQLLVTAVNLLRSCHFVREVVVKHFFFPHETENNATFAQTDYYAVTMQFQITNKNTVAAVLLTGVRLRKVSLSLLVLTQTQTFYCAKMGRILIKMN